MTRTARALLVSVTLAALVACGGGSSSSASGNDEPSPVLTGVFVDGLVEGVTYKTSSGLNGVTSSRGEYQYRAGDRIGFYVGSVLLGEFTAAELVSVLDAPNAAEVAMFLQALDVDGNAANGILIPAELAARFNGSSLTIEEVVPGEPGFEAAFLAFAGEPFEGEAQSALQHSSYAAMQQLLGGSVLWQYYGGDIDLDLTGRYNTAALDAQARHRLNLYAYRYFVYPQLLAKQYMLNASNVSVQNLNARNQDAASEIGSIAGAVLSVKGSVDEKDSLVVTEAEAIADNVQSEIYGYALAQTEQKSGEVNNVLVKSAGAFLHRFASGIWDCKEALTDDVAGCAIGLSTQAFNTFSDGFTVFKLSSNIGKLHTLVVVDAYLDSHYRHAGDRASINREFGLPPSTSYTALLEALPTKVGAAKADLEGADELITLHRMEVIDSVNTMVQNLGLDGAMPKGQELAPGSYQASFVPGSAKVQNGQLELCFELRNNLLATDLNLRVEVSDSSYPVPGGQVFRATYPLKRRADARHCVTLDRPLDLASGEVLPLRLEVVDVGSGQIKTDALVVSLVELQRDLAVLKDLTVPDFATQVVASAPDMPEDGLIYGVNFFRIGLDAVSKARLDSQLPNATYAWREVVFTGAPSLWFYAGYTHQQEAIVKFPALAPGAAPRSHFLELKVTNPLSGLFKTFITRVDLSHTEVKVTSITPVSALLNTPTVFTVRGQAFPVEMTAQIQGADCPEAQKVRLSSSEFQLTCQYARAERTLLTVVTSSGGESMVGGTATITFSDGRSGTVVPHTGITFAQCLGAGSTALINCASAEALALNSQQDGHRLDQNPMSYSLVARVGGGAYDKTECVQDEVTGLTWEGKQAAGGDRGGDRGYTHYDVRSGGTQAQMDAGNNTHGYVATVNAMALCGYTDWRLPTADELQGLVDFSRTEPAIDTTWFPNTAAYPYWTSPPVVGVENSGWYVSFVDGQTDRATRFNYLRVRLVRSGP